jgi:hypothetical protein
MSRGAIRVQGCRARLLWVIHITLVRFAPGAGFGPQAANGRVALVFGQPQFDFEDAVAGFITLVLGMLALNLDLDK